MAESTRIYKVASAKAVPPVKRLVLARNASQALRHVVEDTLTVEVATQFDCVLLANEGVKVETAGEAS